MSTLIEPYFDMRGFQQTGRTVFCTNCHRTVFETRAPGAAGRRMAELAARSHDDIGCESAEVRFSDHQSLAAYRLDANTTFMIRLGTAHRGTSPIAGWGRSSLARTVHCRECNRQIYRTNIGAADGGVRIVEIEAGKHLLTEHLDMLNRHDRRADAFAHLPAAQPGLVE